MTQIRTLLNGMALNSYKLISLASESTSFANLLPRTMVNFDGKATDGTGTFASDLAITNNPLAGVGGGDTPNEWAFSGAAISEIDGKCTFLGGGHRNSGDGSIYVFDPETASENINGGGSGIAWSLAQPSARYIDAFTNVRPSSVNSPAGAQEGVPTTPTGTNQAYWLWPNKNGVAMPGSGHSYHFNKYLTGTRRVLLSQWGSMDVNQGCSQNAIYTFDDSTHAMTGPLVTSASIPSGGTTSYGFPLENNGATGCCVNPRDGTVYAPVLVPGAKYGLYQWTNPTTASVAVVDTGAGDIGPNIGSTFDVIVFPDPFNSGQDICFMHNPNNLGDTRFLAWTGIGAGTPVPHAGTYSGTAPITGGSALLHYAWDTVRSVIWMTDGNNLYKITPASVITNWTISAAISGFTGDVPPTPTGGDRIPAIQYIAAHDCLVHVYQAGVRLYKPSGWNPPADIVPALPYQPWYQRGPILAQ